MYVFKEDVPLDKDFPFDIQTSKLNKPSGSFHWHDALEISLVKSGRITYFVNGQTYPLSEGDIIIFNDVEPHAWEVAEGEEMVIQVAAFKPEIIWNGESNLFDYQYLEPFKNRGTNFQNKLPGNNVISQRICKLMLEIEYELNEKSLYHKLMIKAKLLEIITLLMRHFQQANKCSEDLNLRRLRLNRLQKVLDYLKANYSKKIKLEDVAAMLHMNPNYFSNYFKNAMGISFIDYLLKLRIANADTLISTTDRTMLDISMECGFNSLSNFYSCYKKVKGQKPASMRK